MQTDGDLDEPFVAYIPPLMVRQLMQGDILKLLRGVIRPGQDNARVEKADQHRRRNQRIDAQLHRPPHSGLSRGDCQLVQPLQVENRGQPGLDIAHKALIDGDFSEQQSQRAAQPEQPEIAGRQGRKVRKGTGCG